MEIKKYCRLLPLLPILCGCQAETSQDVVKPSHVFTVRATMPGLDNTRAQITYGNPNPNEETFMWNEEDEVFLFNITRLADCPNGLKMITTNVNMNTAVLEEAPAIDQPSTTLFEVKAGDLIFANYYATERYQTKIPLKDSKIFTIIVGTESNKPQYIVKNPDNASLEYMHHNLKMYDIVTAVKDNEIPDLHFRHLSAILRISLRNETGEDIFPTKLDFHYPGTESFFNTTLYCSVNTDSADGNGDLSTEPNVTTESPEGSGLTVYTGDYFYNGSEPYTDNIGSTINGKEGTADAGESIKNGETYDLYITTIPRINNDRKGDKLTIDLTVTHDTDHHYSITLDNFNTVISAGKRYWFNLTAVKEIVEENGETVEKRKLMFTTDWEDQQEQKANQGEATNP